MSNLFHFTDQHIAWQNLGDFPHFVFSVLDVDDKTATVDAILKFDPNERIFLHRHCAHTNTFVIHGNHLIYSANGALEDTRLTGSYTSSNPSEIPHTEGGGSEGAIVFYSVRGERGVLFEILDDQGNIVGTLSYDDFKALLTAA